MDYDAYFRSELAGLQGEGLAAEQVVDVIREVSKS